MCGTRSRQVNHGKVALFIQLNTTLSGLKEDIKQLKREKGIDSNDIDWKESIENDIVNSDNCMDQYDHKVKLLTNIVIRQDERIRVLENRLTAAYAREIKPNLKISGIEEKRNETRVELFELLTKFFKETMQIESTIEINDAYCVGQGVARSIMVKLRYVSDKAVVFGNAKILKGKQNEKKQGYFVQDDQTDEQKEHCSFYRDLVNKNKERDDENKLTIKMQKGKIMVNNNVVKEAFIPPDVTDILRLNNEEAETACAYKLIKGPQHVEKGSEYFSYIFKAKNVKETRITYNKIKTKFADATHVSCTYRLENPTGPYRQQAIDDGDAGVGRSILKILKKNELEHIGVFVVRFYGKVHLGKRRFEIAEQLTEGACKSYNNKLVQDRPKSKRQISQTSISSVLSAVSIVEDSQAEDSQDEH